MSGEIKKTAALKSYEAGTKAVSPLLPFWLKRRAKKGKEDPKRVSERHGIASAVRPAGELVWLHAASVGESQMLMPVIERILATQPDMNIVVTTGTVTSAELLIPQLSDRADHQYAPADLPKAVKRFLDHWQPDLVIFAESELWPNIIMQTKARDIPMALINARMSAKSLNRWAKQAKVSGKALLSGFDLILAADESTAAGLSRITGRKIEALGNLKDAAPALPVDEAELKKMKSAIGRRPVWAATSTHKGEELMVAKAMRKIRRKHKGTLLIVAPRHPERAAEVKGIMTNLGLKSRLYSSGRRPVKDTDVYIIDGMGHLGLVYRLASVSLVGGSMVKGLSGHNPLEPARLASAILSGPYVSSFADMYKGLSDAKAVRKVSKSRYLPSIVMELLKSPSSRRELAQNALDFAKSRDSVLDRVWAQLEPMMPEDLL
jgi:3-deoxy-D-manno-octulosonic-acid transferase